MRVYMGEWEIYYDYYGDLCEPAYGSYVFVDFEKARAYIMEELDRWLKSNGYDEEKNFKEDICYRFFIRETDTEDSSVEIEWDFFYDGTLRERVVSCMIDYPGDELPGAGMKFKEGDFVARKGEPHPGTRKEIYLVGGQPGPRPGGPDRREEPWENVYYLEMITDRGCYDHTHYHESELELYKGKIPLGLQALKKIKSGEAQITVERIKEIFDRLTVQEKEVVERIIKRHGAGDENRAPAELLGYIFACGYLILPGNPTYRDVLRQQFK